MCVCIYAKQNSLHLDFFTFLTACGGVLICVVGFLQLTARKVDDTFKIPKYVFPCSVIVLSESKTSYF